MKTLSLSVLTILAFATGLRAQQPIPPPDTVFPLGGLEAIGPDETVAATELPKFGLNMLSGGRYPGILGVDVGNLNYFFPQSSWNPLFAQWDFDLVSNESGAAAWDLTPQWQRSPWNRMTTYNIGDHVTDQSILWFCIASNTNDEPPGTSNDWQIAKLGQPVPLTANAGAEWDIPPGGSPSTTTYLDASGVNSLTETAGNPSDLLGGAGVLYLDFVSRLDMGTFKSPNYTFGNTTNVYEINASALVIEQQTTDGGNTWTTRTTNLAGTTLPTSNILPLNPPCGDPSCPTCVCITKGDYTAYNTPSTPSYGSQHFGNDYATELTNILNFPNPMDPGNPSSNPYSVFRLKFVVPGVFDPNQTLNDGTMIRTIAPSMNFSLKGTQNSQGIFVRGVRIRSDWADDLYRGEFDTHSISQNGDGHTLQLFSTDPNTGAKTTLTNGLGGATSSAFWRIENSAGANNWKGALGFNVGLEPKWPLYRCFAYINEQFRAWSKTHSPFLQKNLSTFVGPGNLTYWRSIYEDQSKTNAPPPPFQMEGINFGKDYHAIRIAYGSNWGDIYTPYIGYLRPDHDFYSSNPIFPGDAIPSAVKNHPGFLDLGRTITGWNFGTPQYGATSVPLGTMAGTWPTSGNILPTDEPTLENDSDNYMTYTWRCQNIMSGISNLQQLCAESAYPQNQLAHPSTVWTSFYSYPSTFEVLLYGPFYRPQNFNQSQVQVNLLSWVRGTNGLISYDPNGTPIIPYNSLTASSSTDDLANINNALRPTNQPNTSQEIRAVTWDAITWGAKGIIYNNIGSDGHDDIGFCGNKWEDDKESGFNDIFPLGDPDPSVGPPLCLLRLLPYRAESRLHHSSTNFGESDDTLFS
jgi:hypothetical protein